MSEGWKIDEETFEDIEGLIFKTAKGIWVAVFQAPDGKLCRCQLDFNPFTGQELDHSPVKYHSYYEIEKALDMTTSDAQGYAEANPERLAEDFQW